MTEPSVTPLAVPIGAAAYRARRERVAALAHAAGADLSVWWANHRVSYLSGFAFVPTERPIALVIADDGETVLFVPRLELEHAQAYAHVDRVESCPEFPGERHPMHVLADLLRSLGLRAHLGGDGAGYPKVMGYTGPAVTDLTDASFTALDDELPGLGGFRHSDTILVTASGPEFLTDYPRELGDLVLPL